MFGYHDGGFAMMGFGWIFLLLIIIAVFYVFKSTNSSKKTAKDILDERYAKGEIDIEEYNERKKNLDN